MVNPALGISLLIQYITQREVLDYGLRGNLIEVCTNITLVVIYIIQIAWRLVAFPVLSSSLCKEVRNAKDN